MEVVTKSTKRLAIRANWDINVIEYNLKEQIGICEIWGDLDLSIEEYNNIKSRILGVLGNYPTGSEIKRLFSKYPITMVSDIINFVLFEFDNNDFWSSWANRFNVSLSTSNQAEIGSMVRGIFKKYNFEIIEDGGFTYVTPILCQAGIPCACFNKIFDILDSTLNSPYFVAREIVDELRGYRNYLIDAPAERYFRLHTERAIDLISGLREMMHSLGIVPSFDNESLPCYAGVETRIIQQYVEWCGEHKSRGYKAKNSEQYFNAPKLVFDSCKGICIFIPGQILRQDMIYKLQWKITCDDGEIINSFSQVYSIDGRNCTNEKYIAVDFANTYKIELFDADDTRRMLTNAWLINGINEENPVLAFNESGTLMPQKFISRKGTTIIFDLKQTHICDKHGVQDFIDIDLPKSWLNVRAINLYPAEKGASIEFNTCGKRLKIECKRNFDIDFMQSGTLFDEKFTMKETPIFVKFPTVEISGDVEDFHKLTFDNWQVSMIHRLSNIRHTVMLLEIGIIQYCDGVRFSLSDYAKDYYEGLYGSYEIKIYDGRMRHSLAFCMAPAVEYSAIVENINEKSLFHKQKSGFYFKNIDTFEVEFENGTKIIPKPTRGTGWNQVLTESKGAYINGQIVFEFMSNKYKVPFKKTIRNLQWQFWNETQNELEEYGAKLFLSNELKNAKWRLALHFINIKEIYEKCKIVLESSSGETLQDKEIAIDSYGNSIVTMNLFQDTITDHKLPQRLMLHISKENEDLPPICLAVIRNFVELRNPKLTVSKDRQIIYWDKGNDLSGKKIKLISLNDPTQGMLEYQLDNISTFNGKEGIMYEGIIISEVLPNGVYRIDATEDEDGFFFDDDISNTIYTFERERVLCVNGKQLLDQLLKKDDATFDEWLSASIISLCKKEWVDIIAIKMQNQIEKHKFDIDIDKCTPLLFFLLLATNDKSNLSGEIKEKLIGICESINLWCISDYDRTEILKHLMDSNMDYNDCLLIIEALQLYLFKFRKVPIFDRLCMQRMWEINENLAVLANIRKCTIDAKTDLLRILSHISFEAFEQIIKFSPNAACETSEWLDCFENVLNERCRCEKMKFELSKRVWGDGNEWSSLFAKVKSEYKLIPPDNSHSDGYEIMGANYLNLIYTLITRKSEEAISAEKKAIHDAFKVENLISKYNPAFTNIHTVLRKRTGDGAGDSHKLFYLIGTTAILEALASSKKIDYCDLREILPFWKNAMKAYPKLVYRDLIVAELSVMFRNERSK